MCTCLTDNLTVWTDHNNNYLGLEIILATCNYLLLPELINKLEIILPAHYYLSLPELF